MAIPETPLNFFFLAETSLASLHQNCVGQASSPIPVRYGGTPTFAAPGGSSLNRTKTNLPK